LLEPFGGIPLQTQDRLLDAHLRGGPGEEVHEEAGDLVVADHSRESGRKAHDEEAEAIGGEAEGDVQGVHPAAAPSTEIGAPVADLAEVGAKKPGLGRTHTAAGGLHPFDLPRRVLVPQGQEVVDEESAEDEDDGDDVLLDLSEGALGGGLPEENERVLHLLPDAVSDLGAGGGMVPPGVLFVVADGSAIFYESASGSTSVPSFNRDRTMKEVHDVGPFFMPEFGDKRRLFPYEICPITPEKHLNHPHDGCYDKTRCVLGKICTQGNPARAGAPAPPQEKLSNLNTPFQEFTPTSSPRYRD
jgi:hypothetical protein